MENAGLASGLARTGIMSTVQYSTPNVTAPMQANDRNSRAVLYDTVLCLVSTMGMGKEVLVKGIRYNK